MVGVRTVSAWHRLPTLRQLTVRLRAVNEALKHPEGGPGTAYLYHEGAGHPDAEWVVGFDPCDWPRVPEGAEVPANDTFDAVAAARRLLAAAKDAGYR